MPSTPVLDDATLARQYGWALSLLQSDPELSAKFHQAVAETWDPDKFAAEIRNTNWYRTHSESWRTNIALANTDPATYNAKQAQAKDNFYNIAAQMGADLRGGIADGIAQQAFDLGWTDQQIKEHLVNYINFSSDEFGGMAGAAQDTLNQYVDSMGIKLSPDSIKNWAKMEAEGRGGVQIGKDQIMKQAMSAFPPLADRIRAGESVDSIAEPYKQSMSKILELNSQTLDLYDPTIRNALLAVGKDGKPTTKSLWQFENDLRKDTRWLKTSNAQDATMSVTKKVLQDMGLTGAGS